MDTVPFPDKKESAIRYRAAFTTKPIVRLFVRAVNLHHVFPSLEETT